eukprot:TRINITY_DN3589_c0_g1_i1.p1 TRINITY_DN3589_c0_g1~~TRINITY_DN3589_c0_g1_i1.p1  ORF type:complete len:123 (-),score=20.86 TRINITY_DN3589_c0_g1_i1:164-532(-)
MAPAQNSPLMKILTVLGIVLGVLLIVISVMRIQWAVYYKYALSYLITSIYVGIFGLILVLGELKVAKVIQFLGFMNHLTGKGLFFIFCAGFITDTYRDWPTFTGFGMILVGFVYIVLGCGSN